MTKRNSTPSTPAKTAVEADACIRCKKTVSSKSKALSCYSCDLWCHRHCDKTVTIDIYNYFVANPTEAIQYVCSFCRQAKTRSIAEPQVVLTKESSHPEKENLDLIIDLDVPTPHQTPGSPNLTVVPKELLTTTLITVPKPVGKPPAYRRHTVARKQVASSEKNENFERREVSNPTGLVNTKRPVKQQAGPESRKVSRGTCTPASENDSNRHSSVIIFGVPESTDQSLRARDKEDEKHITDVLCHMGLPREIVKYHRLNSSGTTTKNHASRPIRLEMKNPKAASEILIRSPVLHSSEWSHIRIRRDLQWSERQRRRETPKHNDDSDPRSIIIRGIPEAKGQDIQCLHDSEQWNYILEKSSLSDVLAERVTRLPRPAHLTRLSSPRLIKVVLFDEGMKHRFLQGWRKAKHTFATDIKCHESRPREERVAIRALSPITSNVPALSLSPVQVPERSRKLSHSSETNQSAKNA